MDFYEVINKRHSIRSYKSDPVPEEALKRIARAVQMAPSACNMQPCKVKIVVNAELRAKIAAGYTQEWLAAAPAIAVVMANEKQSWKRFEGNPSYEIDTGIFMEHLILAATAEGLASCWICAFEVKKMNAILDVRPPWKVMAMSPLGYGDVEPRLMPRKDIHKIFEVI
ncbi:MAG: nitroreductase family protein [Victivallales bacterium]|nr:nitroreductase family protein [Victivallales bacterium]